MYVETVCTVVILITPPSLINIPSPSATAVVPREVPPSIKLISVAVASIAANFVKSDCTNPETPSSKFNSSGVEVICVALTAAKTGRVPETFGKLIVLSAVGSIVVKFVSWASSLAPSNLNEFCI
jgi:hypothetical protein